jgi:transcriptional regulator with XRE-family HTH domain
MALADQIRTRRLARQLSLAELARQAGISKAYLYQLEKSTEGHNPSAEILYRLAFALGTSVGELMEKDIPTHREVTDVPDSLRTLALEEGLGDEVVKMLAGIQFRGQRPVDKNDWFFLYEAIRRICVPQHPVRDGKTRNTRRALAAVD